jgi:hypothetical protein
MAKPNVLNINFSTDTLIKGLAITCVVLLGIHVVLTVMHYRFVELPWLLRELFDVDEEESVPTWFSSSILLLTAVVLFLMAHLSRQSKDRYAMYWFGLGLGFTFMSVDEIAGFHETLNSITETSWAVPGLIVALLVGVLYLKFLSSLPAPVAVRFMMSGAIFVGGAIGVELATEPYLYEDALDTLGYNLWTPVEEGMEMGGVILFLASLFDYLKSQYSLQLHLLPKA